MAAVQGEARIAAGAPNFRSDPIRWAGFNQTGEVAAWNTRQPRPFHLPRDVLDIARVHGGGMDPHDRPAAMRLWVRQVYPGKLGGRIAESPELQCAHTQT